MKSLQAQLRMANPVPAADAAMDRPTYESILDKVAELEGQAGPPVVPFRWQAMRLAGAALVLVLAIGAGYLWGSDRASIETLAGSSPTELALRYVDARNKVDLPSAQALLGSDSAAVEYPATREAAELGEVFDYLAVVDEQLAVLGCISPVNRPDVVTCDYQMDNRLVAEAGAEPIPGTMRFIIEDGRIAVVENHIDINVYSVTALDPWFFWLDNSVERGFASVYRWVFQLDRSVPTPRPETLEDFADALDIYAPPS